MKTQKIAKKGFFVAAMALSMLIGGVSGATLLNVVTANAQTAPPAATEAPKSNAGAKFKSNEDPAHEAKESPEREAQENANQ